MLIRGLRIAPSRARHVRHRRHSECVAGASPDSAPERAASCFGRAAAASRRTQVSAPPAAPLAPPQGAAPPELLATLERESGPLFLDFLAAQLQHHGAHVVPVPAAGIDLGEFAAEGLPITGAVYVTNPRTRVSVRWRRGGGAAAPRPRRQIPALDLLKICAH